MPKGHIKGKYKVSDESKRKVSESLKRAYKNGNRNLENITKRMKTLNLGKFGENHPCYKNSKKHLLHKLIRETFKYRQWRSDIFTRDNFTCIKCGIRGNQTGGYLEAHHQKKFIDIIDEYKITNLEEALNCEELYNINNGMTLCRKCHLKTDTWGRKKMQQSAL